MSDTARELFALLNDAIAAFNSHLEGKTSMEAVEDGIWSLVKHLAQSPQNVAMILPHFRSVRSIVGTTRSTDLMNAVDAILEPYMGDGIPQHSQETDIALRKIANNVIFATNSGDLNQAELLLREFVTACDGAHEIGPNQREALAPLLEVARHIGKQDLFERVSKLDQRVEAFTQVLLSNKDTVPAITYEAIDFPQVVTVETFMKCNARCTFCPYPEMEETSDRAGVRMPEELFAKIISDLCDVPKDHPFMMNLSRVNEPLLDSRLFDFLELIREKLPQVTVFLPSNGSTLTEKNIRRLADHKEFFKLMVSLNHHEKDTYERVMGLPFDRTIANLDRMHEMHAAGEVPFSVVLTAVLPPGPELDDFKTWCKSRYPSFFVDHYPPTNWFGRTEDEIAVNMPLTLSCKDWYQIHILADGSEAQCCFDSEGEFGEGNVNDTHILDIYNKPWQRRMRRFGLSRSSEHSPDFCQNCTYA